MITPPYDLDRDFQQDLNDFRDKCFKLMSKAVETAIVAGVPAEELNVWNPQGIKGFGRAEWDPLPDVYPDYIAFTGKVYQDIDYVSVFVDRRLMEGQLTVDKWASKKYDEYVKNFEKDAENDVLKAEQARERRRQQYLELKAEFGE